MSSSPSSESGWRFLESGPLAAALCPPGTLIAIILSFAATDPTGLGQIGGEFSSGFWILCGLGIAVTAVNSALLYGLGAGKEIPSAVPVFFATLPLLYGAIGFVMTSAQVGNATGQWIGPAWTEILFRGTLMPFRFLGAVLSAATLMGTGLGLALTACLVRESEPTRWQTPLGLALAIPACVVLGTAMPASATASAALILFALGWLVAAGVAAFSIGKDRRSGRIAVSATVASGAAMIAGAVSVHAYGVSIEIMSAIPV